MQFWLSRQAEVPVREQLFTQIVLGVLSSDLRPGQRLPSTRDLARRFHVHANTVSSAYRELERQQWLEFRHGSGVYVRNSTPQVAHSPSVVLDQLIASLFRSARELGLPFAAIRTRLRQWLSLQPPDHFLLIEPDDELARITVAEMQQALTFPVARCGIEDCPKPERLIGAIPVVLPSKAEKVRKALPAGTEAVTLRVRSVPSSLIAWLPAKTNSLVGVASRWPGFNASARTMLVAAGFHPDGLVVRDARKPGWEKGLRETVAVVCDSLTATKVPKGCRAIPFLLLSESCLAELQRYQEFVTDPLAASL